MSYNARSISFLQIFGLILCCVAAAIGAAGEVDPTFNAAVYVNQHNGASVVKTQPDGKILIGGGFAVVNGVARHGLARLNADGTLDTSFDPPDFFDPTITPSLGKTINSIALQSNGKILVGGRFSVTGSTYKHIVRLNADGSLDTTFNDLSPELSNSENVLRVIVRPDDSIVLVGGFEISSFDEVARLDANGMPDPSFSFCCTGGNLQEAAVQADGRILVSNINIERHMLSGQGDGSFHVANSSSTITEIVVQPDGKILIAGSFGMIDSFVCGRIARLNNDGTVDLTFNTNGLGASGPINDIVLAPDGKIFIGGNFSTYNGVSSNKVAKLNADGTLDNSFTYTPAIATAIVKEMDLLPGGKLAIVGSALGTISAPTSAAVLNSNGTADVGFAAGIGTQNRVREVVQQTDGKVLIVGEFPSVNGIARNSLARLNADGSVDTGFVPYYNTTPITQVIYAVVAQPDGKVLVGTQMGIMLRRLNTDGSQDTGFVTNLTEGSTIFDISLLPNGQMLIAGVIGFNGGARVSRTARLNANGSNDTTYTSVQLDGNNVYRIQQQPDGKIFIAGEFSQIGTSIRGRIARLNSDGSLDTTFNPPGGANAGVYDLDIQSDGKVVIGGAFSQLNGSNGQQHVGRLNADGSLDTGFVQTANSVVYAVKIQPDGKILIGGEMSQVGGVDRNGTARLNSNGALDLTFNAPANAGVRDVNLQSDNKILLAGEFTEVNNISRIAVARLLNPAAAVRALFDYDGDGKADISVFRPATNQWYEFLSTNSTVADFNFGVAGDVVAPADYDGDGKTDLGIFRPSSGDWWYAASSAGGQHRGQHWGDPGDIPRPSDFDGDGKADFVSFRPSNNYWYRLGSTGAVSLLEFGLTGDKPVTGDFDGDGKSDLAIYRPSSGDWWYAASSAGGQFRGQHWGDPTDIPAPADYDGDGKTDMAVFRPSVGGWYILNSSNLSFTGVGFGLSGDKPVPGDYDGDGKADIAVFRPSTGIWYLLGTTSGFTGVNFGVSTDIPTENAFVP